MRQPADQPARDLAIDPRRSVIVQAPAGSGKTGLLVRRFLTLLAGVEAPEQILAITFTRKATAEMRQRVLCALQAITAEGEAETDPLLLSLGTAARKHDAEQDWQLLDNSRRLRIQTIDSFCGELVRRMPWSARFGAPPMLLEDAAPLYEEAASLTLDMVEDDSAHAEHCAVVLELMDSNRQSALTLLADMLQNRDQWMRSLEQFDRQQVEGWWRATIDQRLDELNELLDPSARDRLPELARYAASGIQAYRESKPVTKISPVEVWLDVDVELSADWQQVALWRGLAALVLTNEGTVRKSITVTLGFPPKTDEKESLLGLLADIQPDGSLHRAWQRVSILPDGEIDDCQWRVIEALLSLLPVAAAQLRVLFSERNLADYTELAQRADMALGRVDDPSDLALAMDYRLQHVLVDEFQDTSTGQIQLLEKLLAGWTEDDGRTAFFVGDPMQSIYRFRQAEVAIFMDTQDHGIDDLRPQPTTLSANFRSDPKLVDWFNQRFIDVMPRERDILNGAVDYTPAEAFRDPSPGCIAMVHPGLERSDEEEASRIVDVVEATLEGYPEKSIAILGRARGHLAPIITELDQRQIDWQGVKLQKLDQRQAIQDLLALTLALNDPADRVAWLGVLRGPWLGATLAELSLLFEGDEPLTVLEQLNEEAINPALDPQRQQSFRRVRDILREGIASRGQRSLATNLEACWLQLGGPAALTIQDVENSRRFLELVQSVSRDAEFLDRVLFEDTMKDLYAEGGQAAAVQLMTIHASKGIEFDTVILPGLHRPGRGEGAALLRWRVLPDRVLVAPRTASDDDNDRFYDYLGELDKEHQRNEISRLIYVACTRARSRLHLFASVAVDEKKGAPKEPSKTSLLSVLWPAVSQEFFEAMEDDREESTESPEENFIAPDYPVKRLPADWRLPALAPAVTYVDGGRSGVTFEPIEYDWAQTLTRITGIVVHQAFEAISDLSWETWCDTAFDQSDRLLWRNRLARHGLCGDDLDRATRQVEDTLTAAKTDPGASRLFSASNTDVQVEWPLAGVIGGRVRHVVLDRVFTDPDGVRWIVDFKSGSHDSAGDVEAFFDQERQRYRSTMHAYAQILGSLEQVPVRTALYYPAMQRLIEL